MRVYIRHLRMARFCHSGARDWWIQHGFDWSDFLSNGIDAQKLIDTGDPFALQVVEIARNENVE